MVGTNGDNGGRRRKPLFAYVKTALALSILFVAGHTIGATLDGLNVQVGVESDYVAKAPMLISVTLTNTGDSPVTLPGGIDFLESRKTVSFNLVSASGDKVELRRPTIADFFTNVETVRGPARVKRIKVDPGTGQRFLVDLREHGLPTDLEPGKYQLEVLIYSSVNRVMASKLGPTMTFLAPTDGDSETKRRLGLCVDNKDRGVWASVWTILGILEGDKETGPSQSQSAADKYYFYRFWADAIRGDLADLDSSWSDRLAYPELKMINYEHLLRNNERFRAAQEKRDILTRYPELGWRFDVIGKGRDIIATGEAYYRRLNGASIEN